jgi:hypothetical protein
MWPDPLDSGGGPPEPRPEPSPRRVKNVTCSFCGSQLDSEGTYVRLGSEAKTFRDAAEVNERLQAQVIALQGTIDSLRGEVERLKNPAAPSGVEPTARRTKTLTL